MKKILYRFIEGKHKFYGLVGIPDKPKYGHGYVGINYLTDQWQKEVDKIKSNAPEIINPEVLHPKFIILSTNGRAYLNLATYDVLKDNDIFDLPKALEFKYEEMCSNDSCPVDGSCEHCANPKKVLRIVKPRKNKK